MQTIISIDNQRFRRLVVQMWFRKKGVYLVTNRTISSPFWSGKVSRNISGNSVGGQLAGLILPVNQTDDNLDHRVHLVSVTLGNHQGKCNKRSVGDAL